MKHLYNNNTLEHISSNLPTNMPECHKVEYINTCKRVIDIQLSGYNLEQIETLMSYNHRLISLYICSNF